MKRILFILLFVPIFLISQQKTIDKVNIYLDCFWYCDADFLQREMSYIDFFRDAKSENPINFLSLF